MHMYAHVRTHVVGKTPSSLNGKPAMCIVPVVLLPAHWISMHELCFTTVKISGTSPHTVLQLLVVFCNLRFLREPQFGLSLLEHFLHSINSANIFSKVLQYLPFFFQNCTCFLSLRRAFCTVFN